LNWGEGDALELVQPLWLCRNFACCMRKNPFIKWSVNLLGMWLLLSCAAEAPASGGPEDTKSPLLLLVVPANETASLPLDARITLKFDEAIDPLSVPAAVHIDPDIPVTVKSRRNIITIDAVNSWPKNSLIRIDLTRSIRDYRNNELETPIQLIYSTGVSIPGASISGKLQGIDPDKKVELGLYRYPISDTAQYTRKIEASRDGHWKFDHLPEGNFLVGALEGELSDFGKDYRKQRYGLLSRDYISLADTTSVMDLQLLLGDPLERLNIKSIDFQNEDYITLSLSDGSEESFSLQEYFGRPSRFAPGDTVVLSLDRTNRLESYTMSPYSFVIPAITDTLPPTVVDHFFQGYYYHINFSESVLNVNDSTYTMPLFVEGIIDTEKTIYYSKWLNHHSLEISDIRPETESLQLKGAEFMDSNENFMADSIVTLKLDWRAYPKHLPTGDILGNVRYRGQNPLVVSATDLHSDSTYYTEPVMGKYAIKLLPPGEYKVQAYEKLNKIHPSIYFSGLWSPYQPSARIVEYPDTVEVRARWSVEEIDMEF